VSLTSHLKPGAVLKPWFEEHYPNVKFMQTAWRSAGPPTVLAPQGANPALVGTAFDYRLRLFLDPSPDVQSFVAHRGTLELDSRTADEVWIDLDGDRIWRSRRWDMIASYVKATLLTYQPAGVKLPTEHELGLARMCCLLARLEVPGRVSNPIAWGEDLVALRPDASIEQHLAIVSEPAAQDVVMLITAARSGPLGSRFGEPFLPNPRFPGSRNVGGADADFVIGGTLVELKTSIEKSLAATWAWQLLGYLLLDWNDDCAIRKVGFYSGRHPALLSWGAEEALSEAAGHDVTIENARAEFKAWILEHLPFRGTMFRMPDGKILRRRLPNERRP
jgi:hypothetical protein